MYRATFIQLSHRAPLTFLLGSFAIILPTSLAVGWLLTRFAPEASGSGIPQLKLAFWKDFGYVPWRVVGGKFIGGALSVGGGSSLRREGPPVQLAGGLTPPLARFFRAAQQGPRAPPAGGAPARLPAGFH